MSLASGVITIEDYDGEKSSMTINLPDLAALGANMNTLLASLDAVGDAAVTIIAGKIRTRSISTTFPDDAATVTDVQAARESKWLITYADTTPYLAPANAVSNPGFGKLFTCELPTALRSLLAGNSDKLNLDDGGVVEDFVTAFEANVRSPYNRSAAAGITPTIDVREIRFVGRNT